MCEIFFEDDSTADCEKIARFARALRKICARSREEMR